MAIHPIDHGSTHGIQVRVGQGPGQTKFLAYRKHGGPLATVTKAREFERRMLQNDGQIGRVKGVLQANNTSGLPGIRLQWRTYGADMAYLYVVGNYTDARKRPHGFAYSVDRHGFEGALALGLKKRHAYGAPYIPLKDAIKAVRPHYLAVAQ